MSDKRDRAWRDYSERFRSETLPKIMSSAVTLSIFGGDGSDFDVKQATELGAMLLLGKPVLLVTVRGAQLPDGLRRAADVVIEDWDANDPASQEQMNAALSALADRLP